MARKKRKGTELSVFKGREAKLNRAILHSLSLGGPQTAYNLLKNLRKTKTLRQTHYGNVNKRIRALGKAGYVRIVEKQKTKAGFEAPVYELKEKAHLAMILDAIDLEELLDRVNDEIALELTVVIAVLRQIRLSYSGGALF